MTLGDFDNPIPFRNQDYKKLKIQALQSGKLFIDEKFPANEKSTRWPLTWKRPKEFYGSTPEFFIDDGGNDAFPPSSLTGHNGPFMPTCRSLAHLGVLWTRVAPDIKEQSFDKDYAGICHFRFYRFGNWYDVVVDDQLGHIGITEEIHQLWPPSGIIRKELCNDLMLKAYAKFNGHYEKIDRRSTEDILVDLTGDVVLPISLGEWGQEDLFKMIEDHLKTTSLLLACVTPRLVYRDIYISEKGLLLEGVYAVTGLKKVETSGTPLAKVFEKNEMNAAVRLRVLANEGHWNGPLGRDSEEWKRMEERYREKIGLTVTKDDEFWMPFEDFWNGEHFCRLDVVLRVNKSFQSTVKKYHEAVFEGEWSEPDMCGGMTALFPNNPQYIFEITDPQDDDVIIFLEPELTSKGRGLKAKMPCAVVAAVKDSSIKRRFTTKDRDKFFTVLWSGGILSSNRKETRDYCTRKSLKAGKYVIFASASERWKTGNFILRIFSKSPCHARVLID